MSLDFYLEKTETVHESNITHNLGGMASQAGLYYALWHPEKAGVETASELISVIEFGLKILKSDADKFKKFNPENGWGSYENLVSFTEMVLEACKAYPEAKVRTST